MIIRSISRYVLIMAVLVLAGNCTTRDNPTPVLSVEATTDMSLTPTVVGQTYVPPLSVPIRPDFVFDWESAVYLPTPPGSVPILAPWSDQANRAFSDELRTDYRKADGWELVYSNFSTQAELFPKSLMLYNKFRGLVRYYYYVEDGGQSIRGNNVLTQSITVIGRSGRLTSPLLNFAEQAIVDIDKNSSVYSTMEPQPIGNKTWYMVQGELAYDQTIAKPGAETLGIAWELNSDQLASLSINGRSTNAILPTGIHVEGTNFADPNYALSVSDTAQLLVTGSQSLDALQRAGQNVADLRAGLAGTVTDDLLTGLFPVANAGSPLVRSEALVQVTRTPGRTAGLTASNFGWPVPNGNTTLGNGPQYNEIPGVFYLDSKPIVNVETRAGDAKPYRYVLNVPSVGYLFNPAVTNIADIRNIRQELVAGASNATSLYSGTSLASNHPLTIKGIRVSFEVVPKNGSTPVRIVKMFKADIRQQ